MNAARKLALESHIRQFEIQDPVLVRVPTLNPIKPADIPFSFVVEIPRELQIIIGVFKGFFDTFQAEDISVSPVGYATTKQQQEINKNMRAGNPAMQNHLYQDYKNKPRGSNPDTSLKWLSNPSNNTNKLHSTTTIPRAHPEKTLKRKRKSRKHSSAPHTNRVNHTILCMILAFFSNQNWSFTSVVRVIKFCIKGRHRLLT